LRRQSERHAGELAISAFSDVNADVRSNIAARDTAGLAGPPPRYVTSQAGFEPAFPWREESEIFTTGVHEPLARQSDQQIIVATL
jgi:hypothetical protein